jgi:hypothetical protein
VSLCECLVIHPTRCELTVVRFNDVVRAKDWNGGVA